MTADLAQACADLKPLLPVARDLTTQPDTDGTTTHGKPGSRPPWNSQAANAWLDVHAGVRELECTLRYQLTGHIYQRGGSDVNTERAIDAISRLAEALDAAISDAAARQVNRWVTIILMLPAVDLEERTRRVPAPCPRCDRRMLRVYERSGRVACLGCCQRGWMMPGTVSDGYVEWEDGEIT